MSAFNKTAKKEEKTFSMTKVVFASGNVQIY
jgi:hypothetical protein